MSVKTKLTEKMKEAMKARDMVALNTIRFLMSEVKKYEIDHGEQDDAGVGKIVLQQVKQVSESIAEYKKAERYDLVAQEEQKLAVLKEFQPIQLSEEEIKKIIRELKGEFKDIQIGPLIGKVKAKVGDSADGSVIAHLVKDEVKTT